MPRQPDHDLMQEVGQRLAAARRRAGMTQADLAAAIAIEPVTLSRYETGARSPGLSVLARAAEALGVRLGDLVDGERELPPAAHAPRVAVGLRILESLDPQQLDLAVRVLQEIARE